MLRKPIKRPVGPTEIPVSVSDRFVGENEEKEEMAPLGCKKQKKSIHLKSLEEQVFGGEIEIMEEVDKILDVRISAISFCFDFKF